MTEQHIYQHFLNAALRNAVRLGCRQLVSFAGNPIPGKEQAQIRRFDISDIENWPDAILSAGFDPEKRSFGDLGRLCTWMPKAAFRGVLRHLSELWCKGSSFVLLYSTIPNSGHPVYYEPVELKVLLPSRGFEIYEHLSAAKLAKRYFLETGKEQPVLIPPGLCCLLAVRQ